MESYTSGKTADFVPLLHCFAQSTEVPPIAKGDRIYGQPPPTADQQLAAVYPQAFAVTGTLPPNSYLAWSIISLLFLCLPFGIAALVFSLGVRADYAAELHAEAHRKSLYAAVLNIIATVLGIALWIILCLAVGPPTNG